MVAFFLTASASQVVRFSLGSPPWPSLVAYDLPGNCKLDLLILDYLTMAAAVMRISLKLLKPVKPSRISLRISLRVSELKIFESKQKKKNFM